jgi:hypothetical protein
VAGNALSPGQVFAGYRLVRRLGGGGFGEVWEADAPRGNPVALKFVRRHGAENTLAAVARELQGVMAATRIHHPNVLPIERCWESSGYLIIAMEMAEGTLLERCDEYNRKQQPGIPRDELLQYLCQAAEGIDHLNAHQVLHYDIKPENLLLVNGQVKVADFGLARLVEHSITAWNGGLTLAYAAPEFFAGKAVRYASDQYSLAATYCRLRSGRQLFDARSLAEWMTAHTQQTPDLSCLPAEEQPAVARALAKEPKERWPTNRDFLAGVTAAVQEAEARRAIEAAKTRVTSRLGADAAAPSARPSDSSTELLHKALTEHRRRLRLFALVLLFSFLLPALCLGGLLWLFHQEREDREARNQELRKTLAAIQDDAGRLKAEQRRLRGQLHKMQEDHRVHAYPGQLAKVQAALDAKDTGLARQLLADCPRPLRGWEWHHLKRRCHGEAMQTFAEGDAVAFSPDGKHLAVGKKTGDGADAIVTIGIWSVEPFRQVGTQKGEKPLPKEWYSLSVALPLPGPRIAYKKIESRQKDRYFFFLEVRDLSKNQCLFTSEDQGIQLGPLALSPDGQSLAGGFKGGTIKVWHISRGPNNVDLPSQGGEISSVAFSPDGRRVVSVVHDHDVRIWDLQLNRSVFRTYVGPMIRAVALSPDGRRLAIGCYDRSMHLWDVDRNRELLVLGVSEHLIESLAFSPDGRRLAVSSGFVWDGTPLAE